ncbi:Peptidase inhibitor I78 family protein [Aliiroseovarius halocynthiae]|uniref:Peptidase inhibitor I78 family protein n=1 Tax=Aliiroseovarius halocynthiae TaxID=985055 RepID=A0A545SZJ3_9RHOB|nr:I78 family peptidase inhibitor [Aliiroseovarius halocynthiae]TQV70394.1 hypothetical protein FIL88_00370 [Aliiroseovarius halocynthiae]SMR81890.1 Peptidase inhibitor I78 family protein [Aliiroseovarius halocynthiae]
MKQLFMIATLTGLAGCMADGADAADDLCGASQLAYLVGQTAEILTGLDLPENRRVMQPDMAYTMDYQPNRLNISIDENKVIDRVWCG